MDTLGSAPVLSRVKSWQLVGLGISGWCTLYSVAILTWGAGSAVIGNAQGGCFAATMALAGLEAKRYKKCSLPGSALEWTGGISTEHVNLSIARTLQAQDCRVEPCKQNETQLGFGVRGVNSGRTIVFETARWKEPVIDLQHVQDTEENRKKVSADLAVIVSAGLPDEAAMAFAQSIPVELFGGNQLKAMLTKATSEKKETKEATEADGTTEA